MFKELLSEIDVDDENAVEYKENIKDFEEAKKELEKKIKSKKVKKKKKKKEAQSGGKIPDWGNKGAIEEVVDDIVDGVNDGDVGIPTRSLGISQSDNDEQSVIDRELDLDDASQFLASRDLEIVRRVSVIENFYEQATNPRSKGLQQSA